MLNTKGQLAVKSALPKGAAWEPKPDSKYNIFLETIGEIIDIIIAKSSNVRYIRNALKTTLLNDLEREFGILINEDLTETERRTYLQNKQNNLIGDGNPEGLEDILKTVDSNLNVYQNDPPVDPQPFIDQGFLIINSGRGDSAGGVIPVEDWPLLFFVGGEATFDVDGSILTIKEVVLPIEKESFVSSPIVSYKGLYTWCVAKYLIGETNGILDAVGNSICDGAGNSIYAVLPTYSLSYQDGDLLEFEDEDTLLLL